MEEENVQVTPCFSDEGINYMHIRHNNLYRKHNVQPQADLSPRIIKAQFKCCGNHLLSPPIMFGRSLWSSIPDPQVLTEYFKELEEESIRDNFVIIYELLDEMMDFGYPQTTESKILQE